MCEICSPEGSKQCEEIIEIKGEQTESHACGSRGP